jgi:cytochrome c-type biogenesis protein CcmH
MARGSQRWRRYAWRVLALTLLALTPAGQPAQAVQPDEILSDTVLEGRARALSHGLRCLVCQNQSIDDSDAPLARDLRLLVRERLTAGDSDAQVTEFLVARYGDFVLLKPPMKNSTLILWLLPLALLAGGFTLALRAMRTRSSGAAPAALTAEEEAALRDVMTASGQTGHGKL